MFSRAHLETILKALVLKHTFSDERNVIHGMFFSHHTTCNIHAYFTPALPFKDIFLIIISPKVNVNKV